MFESLSGKKRAFMVAFVLPVLFILLATCAVRRGVLHTVKEGQTLWQIARVYDVELGPLMRVNNVKDARQLRPGTELVIPGVSKTKEVSSHRIARRPPADNSPPPARNDDKIKNDGGGTDSYSGNKEFDPIWPVRGRLISRFEPGGDVTKRGIRIEAPDGESVYAVEDGNVKMAGVWESVPKLGNIVIILHRENFATVYAHLSEVKVEEGSQVHRGDEIGLVGKSGTVDKTLCYFEIRYKLKPIDPLLLLGDPL
jgi:lipoprotein NlpD